MTPATTSGRYVVLHHTGHGPDHYDLMLADDDAGPLHTWRLPDWPPGPAATAEPLPPHRRHYLAYEGPVSGGRGEVRRVAAGTWALVERPPGVLHIALDGRPVRLPLE